MPRTPDVVTAEPVDPERAASFWPLPGRRVVVVAAVLWFATSITAAFLIGSLDTRTHRQGDAERAELPLELEIGRRCDGHVTSLVPPLYLAHISEDRCTLWFDGWAHLWPHRDDSTRGEIRTAAALLLRSSTAEGWRVAALAVGDRWEIAPPPVETIADPTARSQVEALRRLFPPAR